MLSIEALRSPLCSLEVILQTRQSLAGEVLPALEQVLGFALCALLRDVRSLVPEVQKEPEFNARIRDREADLVALCHVDRLGHPTVLVDVEYAPILIGQLAPPTILTLLSHSLFDESPRAAVEGVEHDPHTLPVQLEPVPEVLDLRLLPLGEDMQLRATCVASGLGSTGPTPARRAHCSACTSSAATPKSPSDRMGLAP